MAIKSPNDVTIFRESGEGLMYGFFKDKTFPLHIVQGNLFKINNKDFTGKIISLIPDLKFDEIKTTDGVRTFTFTTPSTQTFISNGGSRRSSSGISGINVQDEGIQFGGKFITLNFAGASVTVTDDGGGQATITVGGNGMITGGGTLNRLAMFTGATTIGDSPFLRSGSDVIADGFIYFNSGNGIDVVASGGADILNIGTSNADVINYGYAGTTHNMNGTVFNVFTTNLNVTDKIITLNDGGAGGSGGSSGFEIEEAGVTTGYFIQNAGRTGFDFKASSNASVVTLSFIGVAANQTMTVQNASGTIAYLSDIPSSAGFFAQGGNSFGAPAILGTNDVFSLSFETSGVTRETISDTGLFGINTAPVAGILVTVQSTGTTSATWIEQWYNATGAPVPTTLLFGVRDDGYISAGLANGSMTIGLGSGFISTLMSNTFIGVDVAQALTTGTNNTGLGNAALFSLTEGTFNTAVGQRALFANTIGSNNTAVGASALTSNVGGGTNTAIGQQALQQNVSGGENTAVGVYALQANNGNENTAVGQYSLYQSTTGIENTAVGRASLQNNLTGHGNTAIGRQAGSGCVASDYGVFLGYQSGFFETLSNKLFIDNQARASEVDGRNKALIYGKFDPLTANQFLVFNGVLYLLDTVTATYWSGTLNIGVLTWVDTLSPNAPA